MKLVSFFEIIESNSNPDPNSQPNTMASIVAAILGVGAFLEGTHRLNKWADDKYYDTKVDEAVEFKRTHKQWRDAGGPKEQVYWNADDILHDCGIRGYGCKSVYKRWKDSLANLDNTK